MRICLLAQPTVQSCVPEDCDRNTHDCENPESYKCLIYLWCNQEYITLCCVVADTEQNPWCDSTVAPWGFRLKPYLSPDGGEYVLCHDYCLSKKWQHIWSSETSNEGVFLQEIFSSFFSHVCKCVHAHIYTHTHTHTCLCACLCFSRFHFETTELILILGV